MATIIRVAGADFSANPVGFLPPVSLGLEAWHYLGGSISKSERNLAPGKPNAVAVGAPVVDAAFLRCDEAGYLQTSIANPGDVTLVACAKLPAGFVFGAQFGWMISAYGSTGGVGNGQGLAYDASGAEPAARALLNGQYDVSGTPTYRQVLGPVAAPDGTAWQFWVGRHQGGVGMRLANKTTGLVVTSAQADAVVADPGKTYRIGFSYTTAGVGTDIAFAGIYSRALSVDEETAIYEAVQSYMDRRFSITV